MVCQIVEAPSRVVLVPRAGSLGSAASPVSLVQVSKSVRSDGVSQVCKRTSVTNSWSHALHFIFVPRVALFRPLTCGFSVVSQYVA